VAGAAPVSGPGAVVWWRAGCALVVALGLQVGTNYANDYSDGVRGDGIEVRIEDSGPGIPAELREQIFNPFVTTKKTGVGLGLSIVSRIVDGHHGTIRVENGDNGQPGARFVLFFPMHPERTAA